MNHDSGHADHADHGAHDTPAEFVKSLRDQTPRNPNDSRPDWPRVGEDVRTT
jgi:hypothetical protein